MSRKPDRHDDTRTFRFQVSFDGQPEQPLDAAVYAFGTDGSLLARGAVRNGEAALDLAPGQLRHARLFVAPRTPGEDVAPSLAGMERRHAYEPAWRYERDREVYELLPVPELIWPHWFWCSCRVRGRVIKVETLGGATYESPVCHARVHVCEVDRLRLILERLPDDLVRRLRDELLAEIRRPIPLPDPPPFALPGGAAGPSPVLVRAASVFAKGGARALNPQPLPPRAMQDRANRAEISGFDPQPDPPGPEVLLARLAMRPALLSDSVALVREGLVASIDLIRVFWCRWDWFWPWLRCDELAVVETDDGGRFDTTIWYPCGGDHPDLYFWVEASIGEAWETVYRPTLRCHTYWNYACGSEVTIRVTDPRVHGCGDRPELLGKKVVVKTVGRQVSMGEIYHAADGTREGQVREGWIHPDQPSPFAGRLEPRVDFGSGLAAAGITHYRWSRRPLGSTDEGDWQVVDAPVSRHYRETTASGDPVVYKSVQIGPDTAVPGYFAVIDPVLPAGGEDWEVLDEGYDLASAYLEFADPTDGKFEVKLELFRIVGGAMQRVDLTAEGVELYEIADPAPLVEGSYTTAPATGDRALVDPGTGHLVGYRLVLHVDSRVCFGTIDEVTIGGVGAGPCGFLEYADGAQQAHVSFRASHPGDFASFEFRTVRVATPVAEAAAAGLVGAAAVDGFARAGDTFGKDVAVSTLLASGASPEAKPCTRAAFAEALHVYALATNGYGRLSALDAPRPDDPAQVGLRAFAIAPA